MSMKKTKKKIGRKRTFNRIQLFPHKPVNENLAVRQSIEKAFPCKFCRISYIDSMVEEFDELIAQKEMRVAIVDGCGNLSGIYNLMATMQGNGCSLL